MAIIADAIGNAGYKTLKPPIGASIKVAVDNVSNPATCQASNIPRSTVASPTVATPAAPARSAT